MKKVLKVCGMTHSLNIKKVEAIKPDFMGFIFYQKSSRFLKVPPSYLPTKVNRVGVFVNEKQETIREIANLYSLDYIQLHGNESPIYCKELQQEGFNLIKAFQISSISDLENTTNYINSSQYFLFDTPCSGYGGSGKQFNWDLLHQYENETPFFLSGGLSLKSISELRAFTHPKLIGYDINSQFEIKPGIKSEAKVELFKNQLIKYNLL